jgi:AraC-like DNA-binding protein
MQDQPSVGFYKDIEIPDDFAIFYPGLFVMNDTPVLTLEYHDVLELGVCHTGNGVFSVGRKVLPFSAGDVSIIAPGEPHIAQSRRGTTSTWTFLFVDIERVFASHFPELAGFNIHAYAGEGFRNIVSPQRDRLLNQAVRDIQQEVKYRRPRYKTMILSHLAGLAIMLERSSPEHSSRTANVASHRSITHVKKALEYIAQHYYEPVEVGKLARLCGMSPRNFARRFSAAMKRSAHEYIADTRIAMACGHLVRTDAPISYIAEQTGFFSISSFNRTFKEKMGVSPRAWRRRHVDAGSAEPAAAGESPESSGDEVLAHELGRGDGVPPGQ